MTEPRSRLSLSASLRVRETSLDDLRRAVRAEDTRAFAILDACDEPKIPLRMRAAGAEAVSLYRGLAEHDLAAIAPYLAVLTPDLLEWILAELAGTPWGFVVFSEASLADLRKHFRRYLTVESPEGKALYFRFYDPRVLPTFLSSSLQQELIQFFGPVEAFAILEDDGKVRLMSRETTQSAGLFSGALAPSSGE